MMKKILLTLILLLVFPLKAYATITSQISCETRISLRDGARITYMVSGGLEFSDDGRIISSSLDDPNLFITIIRRERNGQERLLRNEERLGNWYYDAPDSNLAIPFSRSFSASPIAEIFHVRSADHGIFIGMKNSNPLQIQIVHYLSRTRTVTSGISDCSRRSE